MRLIGCSIWVTCQLLDYKMKQQMNEDRNSPNYMSVGISLSQIVQICASNPLDFFNTLKRFIADGQLTAEYLNNQEISERLSKNIGIVQFDYQAISYALIRHKDIFSTVFRFSQLQAISANREAKEYGTHLFNFIWLLFLYSKDRLITEQHLTMNSVSYLLMCSVYFTMNQVSREFISTPAEVAQKWNVNEEMMRNVGVTEEIYQRPLICLLHLIAGKCNLSLQEYMHFQQTFLQFIKKVSLNQVWVWVYLELLGIY